MTCPFGVADEAVSTGVCAATPRPRKSPFRDLYTTTVTSSALAVIAPSHKVKSATRAKGLHGLLAGRQVAKPHESAAASA